MLRRIQTTVEEQEFMNMKLRRVFVDTLCEMDPTYGQFVVEDIANKTLLRMHITKAILGIGIATLYQICFQFRTIWLRSYFI